MSIKTFWYFGLVW